jgi:hypothetical protein
MWLCRQILTHEIADMSKCRTEANKQNKTKQDTQHKRNPPLSEVGWTLSGDAAPLVNRINQTKIGKK